MLAWSDLLTPIRTDTKIYFSNKNIFEKYTFLKYSKGEKSLRKKNCIQGIINQYQSSRKLFTAFSVTLLKICSNIVLLIYAN